MRRLFNERTTKSSSKENAPANVADAQRPPREDSQAGKEQAPREQDQHHHGAHHDGPPSPLPARAPQVVRVVVLALDLPALPAKVGTVVLARPPVVHRGQPKEHGHHGEEQEDHGHQRQHLHSHPPHSL
ncbi:VWFA domain-containing protein [Balamuthia mandrillaris]